MALVQLQHASQGGGPRGGLKWSSMCKGPACSMPVGVGQDTLTGGLLMQLKHINSHWKRDQINPAHMGGLCELTAKASRACRQLGLSGATACTQG